MFVVLVGMGESLEGRSEDDKLKKESEIYRSTTRGMLWVSFINKHVGVNSWYSFLGWLKSEDKEAPSIQDSSDRSTKAPPTNLLVEGKKTIEANAFKNAIFISATATTNNEGEAEPSKNLIYGHFMTTDIFEKSFEAESTFDAGNFKPDFLPVKVSDEVGMSPWRPLIYKGGRAPNVPFIEISPNVREIQDPRRGV
jgi:hypothetical protein